MLHGRCRHYLMWNVKNGWNFAMRCLAKWTKMAFCHQYYYYQQCLLLVFALLIYYVFGQKIIHMPELRNTEILLRSVSGLTTPNSSGWHHFSMKQQLVVRDISNGFKPFSTFPETTQKKCQGKSACSHRKSNLIFIFLK